MVRALVVLGAIVAVAYVIYAISGTARRNVDVTNARTRWVATHHAVNDATRIVVRKVRVDDDVVIDEHVVAEIPDGDADFDGRFLEAMAEARARAALFESEPD
ncbi:MAG: hypothetical protein ACRDVN_10125 [Jiangellaceae bacterium]